MADLTLEGITDVKTVVQVKRFKEGNNIAELCHLSLPQAYRLLKKLQRQGLIVQKGKMRHAFYTRKG